MREGWGGEHCFFPAASKSERRDDGQGRTDDGRKRVGRRHKHFFLDTSSSRDKHHHAKVDLNSRVA